jgi:prevent-host-death family protein
MLALLPELDQLPRQNASHVKNKWAEVVRMVRQEGSVAVTHHSTIEMVLVEASTYRQLTQDLQAMRTREQSALDELTHRFDTHLAALQQPDTPKKVAGLFAAKGRMAVRPKAGASF